MTLRSSACCAGPAGNAATQRLNLMSGGDRSDPELAVRVQWEHCDLALAVEAQADDEAQAGQRDS